MSRNRVAGGVVAAILCAAVPGSAFAAATPVSPANGTNIGPNIHPSFQWTLPAGERATGLTIAKAPAATPEGRFLAENVETSIALQDTQTQATSQQALPAGPHWWIVRTFRSSPFADLASAPVGFFIAPAIARPSVRVTRYRFIRKLGVSVTHRGNVGSARITVAAYRGKRRVGRARESFRFLSVTEPTTRLLTFRVRGRRARRLRLVTTVSALGTKVTKRRRIRGV